MITEIARGVGCGVGGRWGNMAVMNELQQKISASIADSAAVMASLDAQRDAIAAICQVIVDALKDGRKVLTAGHGGSAAEAMHMSEEFVGRFDQDRRPLPAVALTADGTLLTCISNDYGFDEIFPRQLEALGQPGDVLVIFSTSGKGDGFQRCVDIAAKRGVTTVGFLGKGGGPLAPRLDHAVVVASDITARVQEAHVCLLHVVLEAVDRAFVDCC